MPLTILVAEDDAATRLAIGDYLAAVGYSVIVAENGTDALKMLDKWQPHLLVTDINMPSMDGYQLVQKLRQQPELRLMPVIFLTARSQVEERIRGYQVGGDIYLPKPFELSELGAVVRNLLERSQMIQQHLVKAEWQSPASDSSELQQTYTSTRSGINASAQIDLTTRELDVLTLLADGLSNGQIGEQLHISARTVEKHVSSLLRKTDTSNRAELVRYVMTNHWIN
ncbi:MAG: response regulator transcription factor [Cyanobacteriota bacterium]|nr:response regulator transcription factor [Cyanobacteriota bacterium]